MVFGVLCEDSLKPGPSLKPRVAPNPILGIGTSRERERERERERRQVAEGCRKPLR